MPADLPPLEERHHERAAELANVLSAPMLGLLPDQCKLWRPCDVESNGAMAALARQVQFNEALQARLARYEQPATDISHRPLVMHADGTFGRDPQDGVEREPVRFVDRESGL